MKRTAILAILIALTASSAPGAPDQPKGPEPFLAAFTPDGSRILVVMRWGGVKVLSVPDLKEIHSFPVQGDQPLTSAAVSPSGRWLAVDRAASRDRARGERHRHALPGEGPEGTLGNAGELLHDLDTVQMQKHKQSAAA